MVDFLRLQMIAHHPRGVQTEEEGAFAVDWQKWKVKTNIAGLQQNDFPLASVIGYSNLKYDVIMVLIPAVFY